MDEYNEEAEFDYEDVIECLKKFINQPKIKNIFEELDMSIEDILKVADDNLIDAEENESLVDYCKRYINFLLIIKVTKNYIKEVEVKDEKAEVTDVEDEEVKGSKFLNSFGVAFEDGDVNRIIGLIIQYSMLPVKIKNEPKGELKLTPAQLTRYQAYIKSYQDDLNIELDKYGNIIAKQYKNKDKKLENDTNSLETKDEVEEFTHNKEYYKQYILTSKKHNEDYISKHPEDPKAILLFKKEKVSVEDYFEAVRFYNKVNTHIIAAIGGIRLKAKDYKSKEEMIKTYNKLKK